MIVDARKHVEALHTASAVLASLRRMYWPKSVSVRPERVIEVLTEAKVRFVLIGANGLSGYRDEPSASSDVDLLVKPRDLRRAAGVLTAAYPRLLLARAATRVQFNDPVVKHAVIDLLTPTNRLLKSVLDSAIDVGEYEIPDLETTLTLRFATCTMQGRQLAKRYSDAGDFMNIAMTNRSAVSKMKLKALGELIGKGGGARLLKFYRDALAGRWLV